MNKTNILLFTLIIGSLLLSGCSFRAATDRNGELDLADTAGMEFGFDEADVNPQVDKENSVDIVFSDDPIETVPSVPETETTAPETESPAPETEAPAPETETPAPETETPAPETETPAPETEAPAPETEAPAPETEAPAPETEAPAPETGNSAVLDVTEITSGGSYTLSGTKRNVTIVIDVGDSDVQLLLNGVTIQNDNGPAIFVRSADKVTITLADNTVNTLSDGSSYSITDSGSTLDAAVFSKGDLTINGNGTLIVNGNYKHGIVSKDDLIISSGTLIVNAQSAALNGKDCVKINSGNITLNAGSDGIRSDNDEDASRGYVYLYGGYIDITCGNDGIQATTVVNIEDVNLSVKAGGGSSGSLTSSSESYKGIKAGSDIYISGGTFNLNTKDDCIHSNGTITISGGTYTLSSGDDGIHADTDLSVSGSSTVLNITKSYEGIEATDLVISDGTISIVASDDGLNAAGGNNASSNMWGRPGQNGFSSSTGSITISGGNIYINMGGDGIDANGSLTITGGYIMISGATKGDTAILDFDSTGTIQGGIFVSTGSSNMAVNFSNTSTQGAMMIKTSGSAGTDITLNDANGNELVSYTSDQSFSCIIISCPGLSAGNTYTLKVGNEMITVTMNSTIYSAGSSSFGGGNKGGMGGRH